MFFLSNLKVLDILMTKNCLYFGSIYGDDTSGTLGKKPLCEWLNPSSSVAAGTLEYVEVRVKLKCIFDVMEA